MSDTTDEQAARPFAATLQELDKGRVHNELTDRLHELIAAARSTGKGGALNLSIKITPDNKTDMLRFSTNVTAKLPQAERAETLFFVDKEGNPTRQDPHQLAMWEANENRMAAVPAPTEKKEA